MLGAQTVTIVRRSEASTDDYGLETYTTTQTDVHGCLVAPAGSSDSVQVNRDPADEALTIYMPAGTASEAGDLYIVAGNTYHRDGRADAWFDPNGWPVGVVVNVKRRLG